MASKRAGGDLGSSSGAPPTKKHQFDPVSIGPVYSLEEMDIKVLQFQNRKFAERIELRRRAEEELRRRIEQLEQRQATDDAVLCVVNRYWNQLDEDVRVLLQRFDAEVADEIEKQNESAAVTSFLAALSQWDKQETEDKLRQRVEFSERAVGKLLQAYDRLLQRKEAMWSAVRQRTGGTKTPTSKKDDMKIKVEGSEKSDPLSEEADKDSSIPGVKEEKFDSKSDKDVAAKTEMEGKGEESGEEGAEPLTLNDAVKLEADRLMADNRRLQNLVTELHQRHHETSIKNSEAQDKLAAAETEVAELRNQVEDLEYQLANASHRVDKLDKHLTDAQTRLKTYQEGEIRVQGGGEGVSKNKFNEIAGELEEQRELATSRLGELEKVQSDYQEALKTVEKLKMDLSTLPESVIIETTEYKCLQSQFSVLYNESMQLKTQTEETHNLLNNSKNAHLRQIEQMELEELAAQKKLRTEMIEMEDSLAQVRREYEVLRIEYEQTLTANEQTGPINREMRNLISSLKNHNEQLKAEQQRYKRKLNEIHVNFNKLKQEQQQQIHQAALEAAEHAAAAQQVAAAAAAAASAAAAATLVTPASSSATPTIPIIPLVMSRSGASGGAGVEDGIPVAGATPMVAPPMSRDDEEREKEIESERQKGKTDVEIIRELKIDLKKAMDKERELKILLDMHKNAPKETRERVQLMAAEKKSRMELEDVKAQLRRMQEAERREKRRPTDDEMARKMKRLEENVSELQKSLAAQKQEEEAMLSEMEVTGQAFEDMQEQNVRLLQQLREKDDANFKLMSERIKSNQIQKLLREEKDILAEQVVTLHHQVEAQNLVVRKLEEKERILINNIAIIEKELALRQQAMELHKRKAVESAQTAADLKLHLDKYHSQLKEAQVTVADKTSTLQQQSFKFKRMQEELATMRKKLDRAKKIEMASSADEVLMEEIREYKEHLTCPSCKVKKKDAVLTKCFHVFCLECLKTRYETRQRKCPKCNATFGANDYHRIYLE